ncbi:hypothetical protein [Paenibacillus silagei]|uniref:Uncharacterized protein n=1 Tax=Paenibacillus silagei TaxID=1670801 RepID=A0ABS4NRL2_9BACL|nr:hypothetical protein [Paenibacillus silagei]MBP2112059.1 hypothetical protein [Paenibacillus silagei]
MTLSKCLKLSVTLLFLLMFSTACQSHKEPGTSGYISLNELESLVDKGAALNWSDFDKYPYEDIGSGVYIRRYPIEGEQQLLVRGKSLEKPPEQISIVDQKGEEQDVLLCVNPI